MRKLLLTAIVVCAVSMPTLPAYGAWVQKSGATPAQGPGDIYPPMESPDKIKADKTLAGYPEDISAVAFSQEGKMVEKCKTSFHIKREDSPWLDYTKSHDEEKAAQRIGAVHMETAFLQPARLSNYLVLDGPLLAIDRAKRRVVVNDRYFSDIVRPDATRFVKGKTAVIGTFKDLTFAGLSARRLAFFLLESQIIKTYWHVESRLCLIGEEDDESFYAAHFDGTHIYFTDRRNENHFRFTVGINKKTGLMEMSGE